MKNIIKQMYAIADSNNIRVGEIFESVVNVAYKDIITEGDHVIDIGAHRGKHLFPMAETVGAAGRVYGFEPIPELAAKLRQKIRNAQIENIKLFDCALSQETGHSEFHLFQNYPAYSGIKRRDTKFTDREGELIKIQVNQDRLDNVLATVDNVTFIKLDIEGGELDALIGGEKLLLRSRPIVIFESGNKAAAKVYNYSKDDFFSFFEHINMQLYTLAGTVFDHNTWENPLPCWEYFAIPYEKTHISEKIQGYCQQVINSY